jgi:hypothetical protein
MLHQQLGWVEKMYRLTHAFIHRSMPVPAMTWQSVDISQAKEMQPRELLNVSLEHRIPATLADLQNEIQPNLPWAEDHFRERVSGQPLNPPPSHEYWPHNRRRSTDRFRTDEKFSHTYPERFWPKEARTTWEDDGKGLHREFGMKGIRYYYGDLNDVVSLLRRDPMTRQAYLPVWFPEDTGVVHGERVPCTLGYHFIQRSGRLYCVYYIRSCDFLRHFKDDVYMAMRLTQWVAEQLPGHVPGILTMHITSFHVFEGDMPRLRGDLDETD